jgi:anti-sigma factor RsiW
MKELLVGMLYDELDPADRGRLEEHLRACPACREELEALRGISQVLKEQGPVVPDLPAPTVTVLPARVPRAPLWAAAAAILVAALLTTFALSQATLQVDPEGWTVAFGSPPQEDQSLTDLLEMTRREATLAAQATFDERFGRMGQGRASAPAGQALDQWQEQMVRRLDDWQRQHRADLHQVRLQNQDLLRRTERTQELVEYTLLASEAPRLVGQ